MSLACRLAAAFAPTLSPQEIDNLGDGHAQTAVYKDGPAPSVCDGS